MPQYHLARCLLVTAQLMLLITKQWENWMMASMEELMDGTDGRIDGQLEEN